MDAANLISIPLTSFGTVVNVTLALCVAILAFVALQDSDEDARLVRFYQRGRLAATRMNRMLKRRHLDAGAYVQMTPVVEIKAQIARCQDCSCKALCDRALKSLAASTSRYSFCPNAAFINRFDAKGLTR